MGVTYDHIPPNLVEWMGKQHVFFVASSALPPSPTGTGEGERKNDGWGYANVSPKDMQGFEVISGNRVRYQDLTGSGVETIAHIRQPGNGKLTLMFMAFEGGPRIVRLFGTGKVVERGTREFEEILPTGDPRIAPGCRAVIELDVHKVGTSCGWSIPFYDYVKERPQLNDHAKKRIKADLGSTSSPPDLRATLRPADDWTSDDEAAFSKLLNEGGPVAENGFRKYWDTVNSRSRDRLPGLRTLAPKNELKKGVEKEEMVIIGGDKLQMRFKVDGTIEEVALREKPRTEDQTEISPPDGANANGNAKTEKVSAVWARRIGLVPSDESIEKIVVDDTATYDGKTVMKLLRRERMRSTKTGLGRDEMVMALCFIVLGLAMGLVVSGPLGKVADHFIQHVEL